MSALPSWARVGAKVVCCIQSGISTGHGRDAHAVYPEEGGIYTIRKIVFASDDGAALCLLVEVNNYNPVRWTLEPGFDLRHFRPLVTDRSEAEDLALFKHHLTQNVPEAA